MRKHHVVVEVIILLLLADAVSAQMVMSGRVWMPRYTGSHEMYPFTTIVGFATPGNSTGQSIGTRTWETEPAGWYRFSGNAGRYCIIMGGPAHFMRPIALTNQFLDHGNEVVRNLSPHYDYAMLSPESWDEKAATDYYQTFVAESQSITSVAFMLAHDGVDGEGPHGQHFVLSIHKGGDGPPDTWDRVGPTTPVLGVDCGGAKTGVWAAGWNSGEVVTEPGKTYAVRLRTERHNGTFQCYWRADTYKQGDCYRKGQGGARWTGHDMWLYVAGDGDGLVIPYNKRVKWKFHELSRWGRKWAQTYVAQGRSLASVMMYTAIAESQGWLSRQRMTVRVRLGGPEGPIVGMEKIACGQNTATGQSGVAGVSFLPGEVPLEPGQCYAIEFEAFGPHTGFNPFRKHPLDAYQRGEAWFEGRTRVAYDLDLAIVEYVNADERWDEAVEDSNCLKNGDMERGHLDMNDPDAGGPEGWTKFQIDVGTALWYREDKKGNRFARVIGGSISGRTVDGGYVQRVDGLSKVETYRLRGRVRSSWPVDDRHQAFVGLDPTGQVENPKAATIQWSVLPDAYGIFESYASDPIRPQKDAISIWLRGRTTFTDAEPFEVDFDDFQLRQVLTGPPVP
jgi:hypothetical protein